MRRDVTLEEQCARVGVQAGGQQQGRHRQRRLTSRLGIPGDGESVKVHDAVEAVALVLVLDPVAQRPEKVAQVGFACWLNPREHPRERRIGCADHPNRLVLPGRACFQ